MPLVQTRGAASAQGFGEFAQASAVNYIEDVFSTYLYTGNNTTNNIVNGIDLAGKGGLVWAKARNLAGNHYWVDTARGAPYGIRSSTTGAQTTSSSIEDVTAFNSNGFSLGIGSQSSINNAGEPTVSWTFRKQPKMFDIQTWTGSGANRTIAHSLGSVPGCIIVKRTDTTADWAVYHRSLANTQYLVLNTTAAAATGATWWNSTTPTSAVFSVGTDASVNASGGGTYVAYLFAHDAGGFGLAGTDNVISCGSYTGNGSATGPIITLGYEPQWILLKQSSSAGNEWYLHDSMRGMPVGSADRFLNPNSNAAESSNENLTPLATGFQIATANGLANGSGETYIYIAIRRGPMKVPTLGTSVYNGVNNNSGLINVGFVPDLALINTKAQWDRNPAMARLTGTGSLRTNATNAEETQTIYWDKTTGYFEQAATGGTPMSWFFARAPGYFDVVCYTGDNVGTALNHNLTVVPELIINRSRSTANNWFVYAPSASATYGNLNTTAAFTSLGSQVATASTYDPISYSSGSTYVSYLFATCAGVSKVGSYSGNTGVTVVVPCGFTSGVRFVLIKRTDSTGDWYVWDSARGIIAGNDPYLLMNSVAAEVTSTDYVDTYSAGFEVTSTAPAALNATGGTYIFLAIA